MQTRKVAARPQRAILLALTTLLAAVVLQGLNITALSPLAPPEARTGARAAAYPYTNVNPYGANTFLSKEVEDWKREKTVQMMAEGGLGWIKQQFPWSEIEPRPGRYWDEKYNQDSWEKYDRIVALAEKHGLRVIARLDDTPAWARPPGTDGHTPPTDFDAYANFVATFVQHYRGRVQYLQIWNEPNLKGEWGGTIDPPGYADLLRRTYDRAKAVDPNIVILSAPLAQTVETGDRGLNELVYLQQLYDAGFARSYDILFANGYGLDQPPEAPPDPQVLNFRRVELVRAVMERNGDAAKPIWLNEYGWNAAPADWPANRLTWRRVSEEQQARYTVDGIRYAREHWPWIGVINIWYFRQVGDIRPEEPDYYFRMVDTEFAPRLIYKELQRATADLRLAVPGRYGVLEPAVLSRGRWSIAGNAPAEQLTLRSSHPGDALTVRFRGNTLAVVAERGPQGGRLGVTVDGLTSGLERLPRDERGRRYLDLTASVTETVTLPVTSNLDPLGATREHTAVLTVLGGADSQPLGEVALQAIEVQQVRSTLPATIVVIIGGGLLLGVIALGSRVTSFVRRRRTDG